MSALELNIALQQNEATTNGHLNGETNENCEPNSKTFEDKNKKMLLEKAVLWNIARDKVITTYQLIICVNCELFRNINRKTFNKSFFFCQISFFLWGNYVECYQVLKQHQINYRR